MENKDYAIGTISILLLIALGVNLLPTDTHYCEDLNISMSCDRLSSTQSTCYPTEGTTKGKKYCSSKWKNIMFEIEDEINIKYENNHDSIERVEYECSVKECKLKEK